MDTGLCIVKYAFFFLFCFSGGALGFVFCFAFNGNETVTFLLSFHCFVPSSPQFLIICQWKQPQISFQVWEHAQFLSNNI